MLQSAAPYRRDGGKTMRVPVVMPLVDVAVDESGYLTIRLDREPYSADGDLTRDDLERVLDGIARDLGTAIRVNVHEADKSAYTDIVTPKDPEAEPPRATRSVLASAFGIAGEGFSAGEQVEVCVIVARQIADDHGTTQLRLPPPLLAEHPDVVLVGRTSGVVALSDGVA